jgi:translation initiation factor IF-2
MFVRGSSKRRKRIGMERERDGELESECLTRTPHAPLHLSHAPSRVDVRAQVPRSGPGRGRPGGGPRGRPGPGPRASGRSRGPSRSSGPAAFPRGACGRSGWSRSHARGGPPGPSGGIGPRGPRRPSGPSGRKGRPGRSRPPGPRGSPKPRCRSSPWGPRMPKPSPRLPKPPPRGPSSRNPPAPQPRPGPRPAPIPGRPGGPGGIGRSPSTCRRSLRRANGRSSGPGPMSRPGGSRARARGPASLVRGPGGSAAPLRPRPRPPGGRSSSRVSRPSLFASSVAKAAGAFASSRAESAPSWSASSARISGPGPTTGFGAGAESRTPDSGGFGAPGGAPSWATAIPMNITVQKPAANRRLEIMRSLLIRLIARQHEPHGPRG